ncbi:F-box/FBD/LRR-repeat protein-like protein [Tanacetum coccineum]
MYPESLELEDINHWILFVSRNGIKDLTLENFDRDDPFKLPTQLYSCMELEHLKLEHCCFRRSPSFQGFPNLRSLVFSNVGFLGYTFGEFISWSPRLEILKFRVFGRTKEVKISKIAKLRNLKTLSLSWFSFDFEITIKSSSIFQLMGLPKLQEFALDFWMCTRLLKVMGIVLSTESMLDAPTRGGANGVAGGCWASPNWPPLSYIMFKLVIYLLMKKKICKDGKESERLAY